MPGSEGFKMYLVVGEWISMHLLWQMCALGLLRCVAANNIWTVSFCVNAYRMFGQSKGIIPH